jgi:hypothetical protein
VQALDHATGYIMAAAVLRGLAQGAATTRVSLARTAALLYGVTPEDAAPAIRSAEENDFAESLEQTVWGAIRRLRPPAVVGSAAMHWALPAGPLGSADPSWQ